jgi:hypothetical protein
MAKRLTAIIIVANVIMALLLYLSSQLVLLGLNGGTLSGFNIFLISRAPISFDNPPLVLEFTPIPNFPFYVFLVFLVVNTYFIIKLQRDKETKQNPS